MLAFFIRIPYNKAMCMRWNLLQKSGTYKDDPIIKAKGSAGDPYTICRSVPCGTCPECLMARAKAWIVRNHFEALCSKNLILCILTYNSENNPGVILYKDVQLFHKRLRKHGISFRFFASAEYGTKKGRPHYHVVYYDMTPNILDLSPLDKTDGGNTVYTSDLLNRLWGKGLTRIQPFDGGPSAIVYQTLYLNKKTLWTNAHVLSYVDSLSEYMEFSDTIKEKSLKDYLRENPDFLKTLRQWSERSFSSKSLGFKNFLNTAYPSWKNNPVMYISGVNYELPYSWLVKLYTEYGCPTAYHRLLLLYERARDNPKNDEEAFALDLSAKASRINKFKQNSLVRELNSIL